MTDMLTKQRLNVAMDEKTGPYLMVPFEQLDELRDLLDRNRVRYYVDEYIITFNDEPEIATVRLGRGGDADAMQRILDGAE